jgi:hypothetical protein
MERPSRLAPFGPPVVLSDPSVDSIDMVASGSRDGAQIVAWRRYGADSTGIEATLRRHGRPWSAPVRLPGGDSSRALLVPEGVGATQRGAGVLWTEYGEGRAARRHLIGWSPETGWRTPVSFLGTEPPRPGAIVSNPRARVYVDTAGRAIAAWPEQRRELTARSNEEVCLVAGFETRPAGSIDVRCAEAVGSATGVTADGELRTAVVAGRPGRTGTVPLEILGVDPAGGVSTLARRSRRGALRGLLPLGLRDDDTGTVRLLLGAPGLDPARVDAASLRLGEDGRPATGSAVRRLIRTPSLQFARFTTALGGVYVRTHQRSPARHDTSPRTVVVVQEPMP